MSKRIMKKSVAAMLVILMIGLLAGCTTTLKGTYVNKEGLVEQRLTFEDGKVEMSAFGIEVEGDYAIEDGKLIITYHLLGLSYDWERSFEKDGSSIFIDGTEFVKEK